VKTQLCQLLNPFGSSSGSVLIVWCWQTMFRKMYTSIFLFDPPNPPDFIKIGYYKASYMTHLMTIDSLHWYLCQVRHVSQVWYPWMCHTVTQYDTMTQKSSKCKKYKKKCKTAQICQLKNEINVTHFDTMWLSCHVCDTKVSQFIGSSDDGRRHGRGIYLFFL
jgi:hypothetical protein